MNFNFSGESEYDLNTSLLEEMIELYGVLTKFLITEKINHDPEVFGDYSHMKSNSADIFEMYMLPEISEDWNQTAYGFQNSYFNTFENINLFVAKSNFEESNMDELSEIVGNLIVLPNNKIMEITNAEITVPGVNNLFTENDAKSVYMLSCRPYENKLINELDNVDISVDESGAEYTTLDTYFQELIDDAAALDTETEVTPQVSTVIKTGSIDTKVDKPIIDSTEDDVFGHFG